MRYVSTALSLMIVTMWASAAAAQSCTYMKIEDYQVSALDDLWRHVTYAWVCSDPTQDPFGLGDPAAGGVVIVDPPTLPVPQLTITSLNDSNPAALQVTFSGNSSVSSVSVLLNGAVVSTYDGSIETPITLSMGSLWQMAVNGATPVGVEGCTTDGQCVTQLFEVDRYRQTTGASTTMTATWLDTDKGVIVPVSVMFPLSLAEDFNNTSYTSVYLPSTTTRIEFVSSLAKVGYDALLGDPAPVYQATHSLSNLGPNTAPTADRPSVRMVSCTDPAAQIDALTWVSACAWQSGLGGAPQAAVDLGASMSVDLDNGQAVAGLVNDAVTVVP